MASQIKPIKVWGKGGPNPPKVALILAELDVPHEIIDYPISDVKKPEYLAINPNGRLPSIEDPNTGITLWESGAILEYLIETYDKENRLSFPRGSPESYLTKQWLYFQTSGQGPYYGQAAWFIKFHHERIPGAIERYLKEVDRISGVLEGYLAQQKQKYGGSDGPWLVGNKCSYADISFIMWQKVISIVVGKDQYNEEDYPLLHDWVNRICAREKVKTVLETALRPA